MMKVEHILLPAQSKNKQKGKGMLALYIKTFKAYASCLHAASGQSASREDSLISPICYKLLPISSFVCYTLLFDS